MIKKKSISITKTARYFFNEIDYKKVTTVVFALHGYGYLAKKFLRKLDFLTSESTLVVCPEGLSRFYFNNFSGKVAASWMTKEDRLDEINDYCNYLNTVFDTIKPNINKNIRIVVLGFSQGTTTMCRWISKDYFKISDIIFCSGDIPEDVNYTQSKNFTNANTYYLYGDKDVFLTKKVIEKIKIKIEKSGFRPKIKKFNGSHQIDEKSILEIIKKY